MPTVPINQVQENDTQRPYKPQPAFAVQRFKRTVTVQFNDEFGVELLDVLQEDATNREVPGFLYAFQKQLQAAVVPPLSKDEPAPAAKSA